MKALRKLLLHNQMLRVWGVVIRLCHALGWYKPLAHLTGLFCEEIGPNASQRIKGKKPVTILALNPFRFRGDMPVLAASGRVRFLSMDYNWQTRILYTFIPTDLGFIEHYMEDMTPGNAKIHAKLADFMSRFLPVLHETLGIDITASAALHYKADTLWGRASTRAGVPFLVLHRENFFCTKHLQKRLAEIWEGITDHPASLTLVHNETMVRLFTEMKVVAPGTIRRAGVVRMDPFVQEHHNVEPIVPEDRRVTFFSFSHGGPGLVSREWGTAEEGGFEEFFRRSHVAFARFAEAHPEVECIFKPKWGGDWGPRIEAALASEGIEAEKLANLSIQPEADAQKLIRTSNVICTYGSTTMLETALVGHPLVVPFFDEPAKPENADKILLLEDFDAFYVGRTPEEFVKLIEEGLEMDAVDDDRREKGAALFEKWVSFLDGKAAERYLKEMETLAECAAVPQGNA